MLQQGNNRRNNVIMEYMGQTMTMKQWAVYIGLNYSTLATRIARGWTVERALTTTKGEQN